MPFSPVEEIIEDIKAGKMVIVCDDEDRENEGDLTMAAELVTDKDINFMATHGKGLICLPMSGDLVDNLQIPEMTRHNVPQTETAFTASIEARQGITTGISAADRAHTCRVAADETTTPEDLVMPGHVFPLRARPAGVMERPGQTESAVDLARLAGLRPAGVICEIMKEDGTMARVPDLEEFSKEHGIKMVTVEQLIEYRSSYESHVEFATQTRLPTAYGEFRALAYESKLDGLTHVALVMGEVEGKEEVLVRLHSSCLTGDALHSMRCDCGQQLEAAMKRVAEEGEGVIVYLQQSSEDASIIDEMEPHLQSDRGLSPKTYESGSRILEDLNISSVRFVTDTQEGAERLENFGPHVSGTESLTGPADGNGQGYPGHPGGSLNWQATLNRSSGDARGV